MKHETTKQRLQELANINPINEAVDYSKMEAGLKDVFDGIKVMPLSDVEKLNLAKTGIGLAALNAIGQKLKTGQNVSAAGKARLTAAMEAMKQATSVDEVQQALLDALIDLANSAGKNYTTTIREAAQFSFTFDYNTDDDDVAYIQRVLDKAGADAYAKADPPEQILVRAFDAQGLAKAKAAIEGDGFELND
jgi:hypothetical protein